MQTKSWGCHCDGGNDAIKLEKEREIDELTNHVKNFYAIKY